MQELARGTIIIGITGLGIITGIAVNRKSPADFSRTFF